MATHFVLLPGEFHGQTLQSMGSQRVRHTKSRLTNTPVYLPGKSHGQSSLVGYSPWGGKESNLPELT